MSNTVAAITSRCCRCIRIQVLKTVIDYKALPGPTDPAGSVGPRITVSGVFPESGVFVLNC
ncbi:MAG: hypothetical protein QGG42_01630 [Phycisphaerae bacterium]|nr:hypothetical protein [Phycisphaerae bacterium]